MLLILIFSFFTNAAQLEFQDIQLDTSPETTTVQETRPQLPAFSAPNLPTFTGPQFQVPQFFKPQPQQGPNIFDARPQPQQPGQSFSSTECPGLTNEECKVVKYTNDYRRKHNLHPLKVSTKCNQAARQANAYNVRINSLSHGWFRQNGRRLRLRAENVAWGQRNAREVVNGWIRSPGHERNMRLRDIQYIGVSKTGKYWAQCFH